MDASVADWIDRSSKCVFMAPWMHAINYVYIVSQTVAEPPLFAMVLLVNARDNFQIMAGVERKRKCTKISLVIMQPRLVCLNGA